MRGYVQAINRGIDDRILGVRKKKGQAAELRAGGILGAVYEGKTPNSTSALPAANYIAADFDVSGTPNGLSVTKLRAACEAMELEEFGMDTEDEIYAAVSPKQKTDLLNLALETKANLNQFDLQQIREGKPTTLLGITWIFTNRLPTDDQGSRLIPLWSKANIIMGVWQDVQGQIFNDTSKRNLPQILNDAYVQVGRIEDGGVRVVRCAEA